MKKYLFLNALFVIIAMSAFGQQQKVVLDKIIAQVGDNIILKSEIDQGVNQYKNAPNAQNLPPDLDCQILQNQIMRKALAIQAQRDSLPFSDDEVEAAFQQRVRYFMSIYGTKEQVEKAAGMSIDQMHDNLLPDLREQLLAQKMQSKITQDVTITPAEVEAYFNQIPKDSLRFYESQFEANQIIIYPTPNQDVVDLIKSQLEGWKKDVETGKANFSNLAKLYSDDPSAKDNGGQFSMNRENDKGKFDPDFMAAAFRLREGQISPVVKSQFGYHIIQMVSRAGNDAIVRHILKIPPVTDVEIKAALSKLDSVRDLLVDKKLSFAAAFSLYNDNKDAKFNAGAIMGGSPYNPITPFTIDEMQDKDLATLLPTMKVGDYSIPQVFTDNNGRKAVRIVYLQSRTKPHRENLSDDYATIQANALAYKQQMAMIKWLTTHMKDFYIQIDPAYAHCSELQEWMKNSENRVEHYSANSIK
ncbi:MAG TPA: peptidylprolyl isomerase [Arachidicoccus soli]|nr:peptidylprolyl isomerase [Arachidicoccus soli]